jgi:predicted glutamine amidotransferase
MLVASEPFDDGAGWRRLRPGSLVVADERGLRVEDDWLK